MSEYEPSFTISPQQSLGLEVAKHTLWYQTATDALKLLIAPSHAGFFHARKAGERKSPVFSREVILHLNHAQLSRHHSWQTLLHRNKIWELWLDSANNFVLSNPQQPTLRQVFIDAAFSEGWVLGDFINGGQPGIEPLPQDLEIVLYVNWLAKSGDFIIHASGLALDGKGYIFTGPSGVGKSTLVTTLAKNSDATILGEDSIVIRLLDDRFWAFGTPWHTSPERCSPLGLPLERLFFLERNGQNAISALSPAEGIRRLLQTAFIPYYRPDAVEAIMTRLVALSAQVKFQSLSYRLGTDVISMIQAVD